MIVSLVKVTYFTGNTYIKGASTEDDSIGDICGSAHKPNKSSI